ncbi:MAG: hypothetical protein U0Z70_16565 [Thermomicrobiales bacterium]
MEHGRFDALTISLADEGTSRRSVLGRLAAGGLAAALGVTAFTALEGDDAEAKKKCKKRCKNKNTAKKRRKCRKRCKKTSSPTPAAGFPITIDTTLLGTSCTAGGGECGTGTGLECVALVCVPIDLGDVCVTGADCATGRCNAGVCAECDVLNVCGAAGSEQCCVVDADCIANACVLPG